MSELAPWQLTLTYRTTCSRPECDESVQQTIEWWWRAELQRPTWPYGWTLLAGQAVCPKHTVTVEP